MLRVVLTLALVSVFTSTASAAPQRTLVFTLKSVQTYSAAIDVPPKGMNGGKFSPGDSIVIRDSLFSRRPQLGKPTGAKIGTDQSKITFVTDTKARVVGSATLPGGTVRFEGRLSI